MTGTCKFCGQLVNVDWATTTPDEYAHEYCDCGDAKNERRMKKQIDEAWKNINALFGADCVEMGFVPLKETAAIDILKQLAAEVARQHIGNVSLAIYGGGKATIKQGSKGEVKVTRQIVRAQTMEAGMFH